VALVIKTDGQWSTFNGTSVEVLGALKDNGVTQDQVVGFTDNSTTLTVLVHKASTATA